MLRAAWCSCRACKDTENGVSVQTSAPFFLSIETPMRRKLALVAVVFIAIAALVFLNGFDDGTTPPELKHVIVGMTVDDVLAIMVDPPTARELPGMGADCLVWESRRGMAVVFLDDRGQVRSTSWTSVGPPSELRRIWRWATKQK